MEEDTADESNGNISTKVGANATKEITNFLIQNPDEITREWLLQLVADEIDKQPQGSIVLVDIVPNLKFLLRATAFMQRDDRNTELEKFETKVCLFLPVCMCVCVCVCVCESMSKSKN